MKKKTAVICNGKEAGNNKLAKKKNALNKVHKGKGMNALIFIAGFVFGGVCVAAGFLLSSKSNKPTNSARVRPARPKYTANDRGLLNLITSLKDLLDATN